MMFKPRSKGSSMKNLLKLKDGDFYVGVFRGEPHTYYQHWIQNRSELCTLKSADGCELCEKGDKAGFRFRVNIVASEGGEFVARVFEGGAKVYDQLAGLGKEYDLESHKVKITRSGSEKSNTVYTIMPTKDGLLSKELLEQISKVRLTQLEQAEASDSDVA